MKTLSAKIEAILFSSDEPVSLFRLCEFLGEDEETIMREINEIKEACEDDKRGIRLMVYDNSFRFTTKIEYGSEVSLFLSKKRAVLSPAALEVLSIAAYNQPVTKTYISQIRGVSSSEIVESLVEKGILEENGHLDLPGKPMSYVTTPKFLTIFGLTSLGDLPELI